MRYTKYKQETSNVIKYLYKITYPSLLKMNNGDAIKQN